MEWEETKIGSIMSDISRDIFKNYKL